MTTFLLICILIFIIIMNYNQCTMVDNQKKIFKVVNEINKKLKHDKTNNT